MNLRRVLLLHTAIFIILISNTTLYAQGIHFTQYFNAPLLLNPANTALMSANDYRLGVNYRKQWGGIPVPYTTASGFADFQLLRNQNLTNWMGLGLAMYSDKAGDGQLALGRYEGFIAYHIQTGNFSMFSVGLSGAYVQRSVDFSRLSYDRQWDGFKFNQGLATGEPNPGIQKTSYTDISAGINYAYYPNEFTYIKFGLGLAHVNSPKESFYNFDNKIALRPTVNIDALFNTSEAFTLNPSVYYTRQSNAQELVYGVQVTAFLSEDNFGNPTSLIAGVYHRYGDAVAPVLGFEWSGVRFTSSYDFTLSSLTPDNNLKGGFEMSLVYQGLYSGQRDKMNCPRF